MPLPRFEDRFPSYQTCGYRHTNEAPEAFEALLAGRQFEKGAGISSSGEVPLLILLPHCSSVIAIDHSYESLACAMMKAHMLDLLGADGLKRVLGTADRRIFQAAANAAHASLPSPMNLVMKMDVTDFDHMSREWGSVPIEQVAKAHSRLDKLTFVHGDLSDLSPDAPFDLLYTSNAVADTHVGRSKKVPSWDLIGPLVREDGGLIMATNYSPIGWTDATLKATHSKMIRVKTERVSRVSWHHHLLTRQASQTQLQLEVA